jgi:receptor expression-enhancing protein 5/6
MIKNCDRQKVFSSLEKFEEVLKSLEENTSIKKNYILIAFGSSLSLIWFGILDKYLSYALTTFYPIFWSVKIIQKKRMELDKLWLSYWTIFSIFYILDMFCNFISIIFPFYFLIRTLFLLWCFLPGFEGGLILYNLAFVKILKISKKLKILETYKKDSLKAEIEDILNQTDEKDSEIKCPSFETNKRINQ